MPTYEEELIRLTPQIRRIVSFTLFPKRVVARGAGHIPETGPVILVSNHCGAIKDPAAVYRIVSRPMFFNANRMLFNRDELDFLIRKHLRRHFKSYGLALDRMLGPLKAMFVRFVSTNIARVGTIPADMYDQSNRSAVALFMEYLRAGRALVSMQGRGRVHPDEPNPYVKAFGRGVPYIAYRLKTEEGLDVPVVPLSIFGTQRAWGIPGRVRVNIGPPLFMRDYLGGDRAIAVERFRTALQTAVDKLLRGSLGEFPD
ncbi:MAG: lysophospholipid acyltransferase family protein [Candidatus Aminicenantales bacterium]